MRGLFWKNNKIFFLMSVSISLIGILGFLLLSIGQNGVVLFTMTMLVGIVGIFIGTTAALGITLALFFIAGSFLFWSSLSSSFLMSNDLSIIVILIWMVCLIILSLITGLISSAVKSLLEENKSLRKAQMTLVAIDPITGFDNKERMFVELELEYNRSKRYGQTFALILLKINYVDQFEKLYGEIEMNCLFKYLAKEIHLLTRKSDQKFKPEKDLFALILPNTPIENLTPVIKKLEKISVYQLSNKKYVTLSIQFGTEAFNNDFEDYLTIYERAKEQVAGYVS